MPPSTDAAFERQFKADLAATQQARELHWRSWGRLDGYVNAPIIHPLDAKDVNIPPWPNPSSTETFGAARRPYATVVYTDGLSDPIYHPEAPRRNGVRVEFFAAEPEDNVTPLPPGVDACRGGPGDLLWELVRRAARVESRHPGWTEATLGEVGPVSFELLIKVPEQFHDRFTLDRGTVGVIAGIVDEGFMPATMAGPFSPIRLVGLSLLTRREMGFVAQHQDEGRTELARRLRARGEPLVNRLDRPDLV